MLDMVETHMGSTKKHSIPLSSIGEKIIYDSGNLLLEKMVVCATAGISFISLLVFMFGDAEVQNVYAISGSVWLFICIIGILKPVKDDIVITSATLPVRIYRDVPNEEVVLEFANMLIKAGNTLRTASLADLSLDEALFMQNLKWLRENKKIDDLEFNNLRENYEFKKEKKKNPL